MQNEVQSELSLELSGNELTLLTGHLNDGYADVLARTRCRVNCGDLTTIANTWKYRLPNTILFVDEMWTEDPTYGTTTSFERSSAREIIQLRRGQTSTLSGGPCYYAIEGHDMLLVWPTPAAAGTIEYLYGPRPTALSAAGDIPSLVPSEWHRAIVLYAEWHMASYDDDGSSQVGQLYRVLYEGQDGMGGMINQIKKMNRWQGGRRLSPAVAGRRRAYVPAIRSADY
jgi:hypothetical protein